MLPTILVSEGERREKIERTLIINHLGNLEMNSIKQLGRLARGEDRLSPYYDMATDAIIAVANILFNFF